MLNPGNYFFGLWHGKAFCDGKQVSAFDVGKLSGDRQQMLADPAGPKEPRKPVRGRGLISVAWGRLSKIRTAYGALFVIAFMIIKAVWLGYSILKLYYIYKKEAENPTVKTFSEILQVNPSEEKIREVFQKLPKEEQDAVRAKVHVCRKELGVKKGHDETPHELVEGSQRLMNERRIEKRELLRAFHKWMISF